MTMTVPRSTVERRDFAFGYGQVQKSGSSKSRSLHRRKERTFDHSYLQCQYLSLAPELS